MPSVQRGVCERASADENNKIQEDVENRNHSCLEMIWHIQRERELAEAFKS